MGTFGGCAGEAADWEEPWCAADEQTYLSGQDEKYSVRRGGAGGNKSCPRRQS